MFKRTMMSPEERAEYDAIFEESCLDRDGELRPTSEAASDLLDRIEDANQAQRTWAKYVHDDLVMRGYRTAVRSWQNEIRKHKTIVEGKVVSRKDAIRLRKIQDSGKLAWQPSMLPEATVEDLTQLIALANARVQSERASIRDYMKLLDLMDETKEITVRGALKRIGMTMDEFLTQESA